MRTLVTRTLVQIWGMSHYTFCFQLLESDFETHVDFWLVFRITGKTRRPWLFSTSTWRRSRSSARLLYNSKCWAMLVSARNVDLFVHFRSVGEMGAKINVMLEIEQTVGILTFWNGWRVRVFRQFWPIRWQCMSLRKCPLECTGFANWEIRKTFRSIRISICAINMPWLEVNIFW